MKILSKSSLTRELKRLARENAALGKPLTIMDDVVFKAMLTSDSEDSREALRSLLSACTRREVSKVKVMNTEILPAHLAAKFPRLDVHVTFNDGEIADLEMQIGTSDDDLKNRAAFYSAMLISGQAKKGEPYGEIKRVYQIFFLDSILFPRSKKIPRRYYYMEEEEHDRLTEVTEIIFYEMPKLEQKVREFLAVRAGMETLSDAFDALSDDEKWCIFMKYWHEERAAPLIDKLYHEEGIMRAGSALTKVDRDYIKFARNIAQEKNRWDRARDRLLAQREGFAEGKAEGHAEGLELGKAKGHAEGLEQGEQNKMTEIARRMKARGRPIAEIAEDTGLSEKIIKKL